MQNKKTIDGCLIRITDSGKFTTYLFRLADGGVGRVFTGQNYRNFHNWKDLNIGDVVSGLVWYDEMKGILNGDSPVHLSLIEMSVQ